MKKASATQWSRCSAEATPDQAVVGPVPITLKWAAPDKLTWRPWLMLTSVLPSLHVTLAVAGVDIVPPSATLLGVGDTVVTATVRDTKPFAAAPAPLPITAGPTILWDPPDPQPHASDGFKLTAAELNAVASPNAGAATYDAAECAVLPIGKHKLTVTFAQSDTHESDCSTPQHCKNAISAITSVSATDELV